MKERMGTQTWPASDLEQAEKKKNSLRLQELVNVNQMFENMANTCMAKAGGMDIIDLRIPKFHLIFSKKGREWPPGCNISQCKERLLEAYEHARSAKMIYIGYIVQGATSINMEHVYRRLGVHGPHAATMDWYNSSDFGDINPIASVSIYNPTVCHGFSNNQSAQEYFNSGSTIVSVGFVDLGILREATFSESTTSTEPTRWVTV